MRSIEPGVFISGQIAPEDVAALSAAGIGIIVNNRPDEEEPGQPAGAAIRSAAQAAGMAYSSAPMAGSITPDAVRAMAEALSDGRPCLAFCKSGMRSALLWAVVRAGEGRGVDELIAAARGAGVELGGFSGILVAGRRRAPD